MSAPAKPATIAPRLFINYRSIDSGATASRLYKELAEHFGPDLIFLDHEEIPPGAAWPDRLRNGVKRATVMFVLIGNRWLTAQDPITGDRCLNVSNDWVRQEIELALKRKLKIVPVFLEDTHWPGKRALQTVPAIVRLGDLQGLPLRRKDWQTDLESLVELLIDWGFKRVSKTSGTKASEPSIELALDRIGPYRTNRSGRPIAYGTVTLPDGTTAFGEGLNVQLTLANNSEVDVTLPAIDVVIDNYNAHPIERVDYPVLPMSGLHLEVPSSTLKEPIELTEENATMGFVAVTKRRLYLKSSKFGSEAQHTLNFYLLARAPGIWKVRVRAKYLDSDRSSEPKFAISQSLCILKT